jgi:hypothetical protein
MNNCVCCVAGGALIRITHFEPVQIAPDSDTSMPNLILADAQSSLQDFKQSQGQCHGSIILLLKKLLSESE